MNKIYLFLFLGFILSGCGQRPSHTSANLELVASNIVNGKDVTNKNIYSPYIVSVKNNRDSVLCTGIIIEDDLILTAAHCLDEGLRNINLTVRFGNNTFHPDFEIHARTLKIHEHYDSVYMKNDIGLIRLTRKIPSDYRALNLEDSRMLSLEKGDLVTSLGYGINDYTNKSGAGILRAAQLSVFRYEVDEQKILIAQKKGGVCEGDSGGPTFTLLGNRVVLVGFHTNVIKSFFNQKNGCANFALLANPNYFYDWIISNKHKI